MGHGGFRPGSGRAKSGYYKGIYCGSTYELAWVIYQLDHGREFSRFEGCLEYDGKKYFPDFIQDGVIIEIKGYESQDLVDVKNNIAKQNGYEIIVLRKENLIHVFDWVKDKYTSDFKTLYDGYRPKYDYTCEYCGIDFSIDKKRKAKRIACSRRCSLLLNRQSSGKNGFSKLRDAAGVATRPSP